MTADSLAVEILGDIAAWRRYSARGDHAAALKVMLVISEKNVELCRMGRLPFWP